MAKTERRKKPLPALNEVVVATPAELSLACETIAACRRFGMDTEFVGEESYHPRLCLIQVATEAGLFLIDPQTVGPLDSFWRLVVDPDNLVIVHAGREEVRLCQLWSGQPPANLFDLQIAAGLVGLNYPLSHGKLVNQVLGIQLTKGETLTEWRNRPLTAAQVCYAFDDVRFLLPLWERLSSQLDKLDRLSWAREEFERLKNGAPLGNENALPVADKWRKLRGLGALDRRRLAVVQELYNWREETAARQNRPARTILRDDLIVEIARRNPSRPRDLQVVRGLPKRSLEAIVEAVQRAHAVAADDCPEVLEKDQDPAQMVMVMHVLSAVLGDLCVKKQLAASLVASQSDLRLLVRAGYLDKPIPSDTLLVEGWRAVHILPELLAVLRGQRSLRIADMTAPAPLDLTPMPETS